MKDFLKDGGWFILLMGTIAILTVIVAFIDSINISENKKRHERLKEIIEVCKDHEEAAICKRYIYEAGKDLR